MIPSCTGSITGIDCETVKQPILTSKQSINVHFPPLFLAPSFVSRSSLFRLSFVSFHRFDKGIDSRWYQGIMTVITVYVLFGDDIRLAACPKEGDMAFEVRDLYIGLFCK